MPARRLLAVSTVSGALLLSAFTSQPALGQQTDGANPSPTVGGAVTVTNNGISLLPTFTLGDPAALFDLSVRGLRLSFEPQFKFALEGRPRAFIFWWRYGLLGTERFSVRVGAHPALAFKMMPRSTAGGADTMMVERYVAAEVAPSYSLRDGVSVGAYCLYGHGLERGAVRTTHFVTVNASFTDLGLTERVFLKLAPQIYYLRMDDTGGYCVTATMSLHSRDLPVSVQSIVNQAITPDIVTDDDFVWNVSLVYSF